MKMRILKDEAEFNKVKQLLESYSKEKQEINKQFDQYTTQINSLEDQLIKNKEKNI
jgi:hypothetical protein